VTKKSPEIPQDRHGLVKLLRQASHNRSLYDVFRDFTEMAALAISNAVDKSQFDERENRYFEVIKPYTPEDLALFPQMIGCLVGELEKVGYDDVLGRVFMELELANKDAGQFFTPYEVCQMMAKMTVDDSLKAKVAEQGYVTVNDPAVGGAATLIAFCEAVKDAGLNPQRQVHATAQDLDLRCVHMAYVQLALLNIPAVVVCGNTLSLTESSRWYTPAHILGGWNWKLRERQVDANRFTDKIGTVTVSPDITMPPPQQMALFPEAA
jgi:type I restriction-modification system DNA methylase subunit